MNIYKHGFHKNKKGAPPTHLWSIIHTHTCLSSFPNPLRDHRATLEFPKVQRLHKKRTLDTKRHSNPLTPLFNV